MRTPNPLITFYVITYNQERFIQQAIEGAFSQTWNPLEVVLSDDCSTDRTFEIMQRMAAAYSGPHTVIVNRNEHNVGVGRHINRVLELSHGEFIIASGGDDVSLPERTRRLYDCWKSSPNAWLVYSNLVETDEHGSAILNRDFAALNLQHGNSDISEWGLLEHIQERIPSVHGATFGYPRELFSMFGPFANDVVFEDGVLNWRAECLGTVRLCRDRLVLHRNHSNQLTNIHSVEGLRHSLQRRSCLLRGRIAALQHNIADTQVAEDKYGMNPAIAVAALSFARHRLRREAIDFTTLYGTYASRLWCFAKHFGEIRRRPRLARFIVEVILPHPVTALIRRAVAAWKADAEARQL